MTNPPTSGAPAPVWPAGAHPPSPPPAAPGGMPVAGGVPAGGGVPQGGYAVPAAGLPGGPVPGYRAPGPVTPGGLPIATFGERLIAYLVDSMIQTGVVSIIAIPVYVIVVIGALRGGAGGGTFAGVVVGLVVFELAVYALFSYLYHVEWILRSGNTVGKKLMKLRVAPLEAEAPALGRGTLAKRWAAQYVVGMVPFYGYLDGFWQLWDQPYRQCLHDKWPRTAVVKVAA